MKFLNNIDLKQNEIQNFRVQNLAAAPASPVVGQHYYNTTDNTEYVWNGTAWIDALSQGDYTFQNGVELVNGTRNVQIKLASGNNAGDVTFTADANGLAASVDLTGYEKGSVEAVEETDTIAEALGKLEAKADEKVVANTAIEGATKTKITYDAKGLVTAGADLSEADIPSLHLAKITDVTATATEVNVLDGIEASTTELNYTKGVTSAIQDQLDNKVEKNDAITGATKTKITYDAKGLVTGGADLSAADIPSITLDKISDVTATAAEVNVLDGITATTAELNILDGVTADKDEINILDGATVTTTELNQLSGVTDNVQDQLNAKVAKNADITAGTHTKITYDAKGLVTGGANLSEADIPELGAAKITNLTGYTIASEVVALSEADTALEAFGKIQKSLDSKIGLTAISIDAASTDYLTYDSATGKIGANVSTSISDNDKNLVTGEAVYEAIKDDITLTDLSIDSASTDYLTYDNTTGKFGAKVTAAATQSSTDLITSGGVFDAVKDKIELTDLAVASASANYAEYDNTTGELSIKAGVANGLATLDSNGTVPAAQLPSYVDDVIELTSITTEPATAAAGDKYYNATSKKIMTYSGSAWGEAADPEAGKIYIFDNMSYRWSGSAMVQIGADKLLGFNGSITGDGTTTSFTINHNLGTRNVVFEIYEAASPYEKVYVQVNHTSTTALTVVFGTAPAVGEDYVITVIAIG